MTMYSLVVDFREQGRGVLITIDEREKARSKPIDYPHVEFGLEVRRLMGYDGDRPFLTSRMAEIKTGVSHSTITTMLRGKRASKEKIEAFAKGMKGDAHKLLTLAGYVMETEIAPIETDQSDDLTRFGALTNLDKLGEIPIPDTAFATADPEASADVDEATDRLWSRLPGNVQAITVKGRCMEPFYEDGDIVLIRRSETARSGDKVVAVLSDGTPTCKIYKQEGYIKRLVDASGNGVEMQEFRIVGIVKGLLRLED